MPNHVLNRVHLNGDSERIRELLEAVRCDDEEIGSLDCNKIIPMPESLELPSGSMEGDAINVYMSAMNPWNFDFSHESKMPSRVAEEVIARMTANHNVLTLKYHMSETDVRTLLEKRYPNETLESFLEIGKKYVSNLLQYGASTWYDFRVNMWGSKWGAYYAEPFQNNTMTFCTAWDRIMPIMEKIAEMYPDIEIEYKWADEDMGNNVGVAMFSGGKLISDEWPEPRSVEAYLLACEIRGLDPEYFGIVQDAETGDYRFETEEEAMTPEVTDG